MRKFIVRLFYVLAGFVITYALAIDMLEGSEQFYVAQNLFENLAIDSQDCNVVDEYVNFACGQTNLSNAEFGGAVDVYISEFLPGLSKNRDWFQDGYAYIAEYSSSYGQYYFAITTNGFVVIAFTPLE